MNLQWTALTVGVIALGAASCTVDSPVSEPEAQTPSVASSAAASSTQERTGTTTAVSTDAVMSSSVASTSTDPSAGALDGVQLRLVSYDEKSPGVVQFDNGRTSFKIEWTALSMGAVSGADKCASVITLIDPSGQTLETDRQSSCTGSTTFDLRTGSGHVTGEYIVRAGMAPWDDADNPIYEEKIVSVIAEGS